MAPSPKIESHSTSSFTQRVSLNEFHEIEFHSTLSFTQETEFLLLQTLVNFELATPTATPMSKSAEGRQPPVESDRSVVDVVVG
jgi:hypothetical protein